MRLGNEVVYVGTTGRDPKTREQEHRQEDKEFSKLTQIGPAVSEKTAKKWEQQRLATYRKHHGGKNPKYNQTKEG